MIKCRLSHIIKSNPAKSAQWNSSQSKLIKMIICFNCTIKHVRFHLLLKNYSWNEKGIFARFSRFLLSQRQVNKNRNSRTDVSPFPSEDPPIVKQPLMFISTFFADFVALNLRFVLFLWNVTHIQSLCDLFYDPVIHKGILLSLPKHQPSAGEKFFKWNILWFRSGIHMHPLSFLIYFDNVFSAFFEISDGTLGPERVLDSFLGGFDALMQAFYDDPTSEWESHIFYASWKTK